MLDFKTNESIQQKYAERKKLFFFHLNKLLLISYFASNNKLFHRKHESVRFVGFHRRSMCLPSPLSSLLLLSLSSPPPLLSSIFFYDFVRLVLLSLVHLFAEIKSMQCDILPTKEDEVVHIIVFFLHFLLNVCLVVRLISIHAHTSRRLVTISNQNTLTLIIITIRRNSSIKISP